MRALLTATACALLTFGCAAEDVSGLPWPRPRGIGALFPDPRLSAERDDREAIARAEETPTYIPRIPHLPPRTTTEPTHTPFDADAARAALHAADPSACIARGAPSGYGHARVTFGEEGRVSQVVVDAPAGMNDDAAVCIGETLGNATVGAFEGGAVTVGTSYFLRN
jgi:hypothetical protein